jgi:hypothetical protein
MNNKDYTNDYRDNRNTYPSEVNELRNSGIGASMKTDIDKLGNPT